MTEGEKKIRSGDRIYDDCGIYPENNGTVGTFIWSEGGLYALTAGHVVSDAAGEDFAIRNKVSGVKVRARHFVMRHPAENEHYAREVAILKIADEDQIMVDARLPRTNVHWYSPEGPARQFALAENGLLG